jgi:hypothetical protein
MSSSSLEERIQVEIRDRVGLMVTACHDRTDCSRMKFRECNAGSGYPSEEQLQILSGHRTRDVSRASTWRNGCCGCSNEGYAQLS